jgi:mannan endo-1,6-alpha-mannosidase
MFANIRTLSFAFPFLLGVSALDLKITNQGTLNLKEILLLLTPASDSIKSAAQTLAKQIIETYNAVPPGSPIGLFDEDYYWWESGAVWSSMVQYSSLTGDSQFDDVVAEALWAQTSDTLNFMPLNQTKTLGNDDQSAWAIAAMTAAETGFKKPEKGEWVDLAKNVFDNQVLRWDEKTCGGGLRWQIFSFNNGYEYKNSISTGTFFLLSARLAQFTGNTTYSEWADKSFKWLQDVQLLDENYAVFDGTDSSTGCGSINRIQWSYPFGLLTEGAAVMYNLTNGNDTWKSAVEGFATHLNVFQKNSTVIYEPACDKSRSCSVDQRPFKGLLARSIGLAAVAAPFAADTFNEVLEISAKGAAGNCAEVGATWMCATEWYPAESKAGPNNRGADLGNLFGALEAIQGLLDGTATIHATTNGTTPTSATASTSGTPSKTGSADEVVSTGTAGKMNVAWSQMVLAGLLTFLI